MFSWSSFTLFINWLLSSFHFLRCWSNSSKSESAKMTNDENVYWTKKYDALTGTKTVTLKKKQRLRWFDQLFWAGSNWKNFRVCIHISDNCSSTASFFSIKVLVCSFCNWSSFSNFWRSSSCLADLDSEIKVTWAGLFYGGRQREERSSKNSNLI